jgi:uncharacterized tellurite resistance protein B-like protein
MLNRIRRLFDQPDNALDQLDGPDRVPLAAACLMLEAARLDETVTPAETAAIRTLLSSHFKLEAEEVESLLAKAENVSQGSAQWYAFTSRLKDALGYDERVAIIEMLWHVVYADGALHHLEQSLLRRVGGLLYVSDRDRGEAGIRVRAALGLTE